MHKNIKKILFLKWHSCEKTIKITRTHASEIILMDLGGATPFCAPPFLERKLPIFTLPKFQNSENYRN